MANLGSDFGGITDLDRNLTIVSGRTCLIQALARRFGCETGAMFDDPTYGYPLTKMIGDVVVPTKVAAKMEEQLLADERVDDADVTVTYDATTRTMTAVCKVDDGDGPFEMVISASDLTVDLLSVRNL